MKLKRGRTVSSAMTLRTVLGLKGINTQPTRDYDFILIEHNSTQNKCYNVVHFREIKHDVHDKRQDEIFFLPKQGET